MVGGHAVGKRHNVSVSVLGWLRMEGAQCVSDREKVSKGLVRAKGRRTWAYLVELSVEVRGDWFGGGGYTMGCLQHILVAWREEGRRLTTVPILLATMNVG